MPANHRARGGRAYWAAGYTQLWLPMFTATDNLYAFTLNGK